MAKNIVVLMDGTWDSLDQKTNGIPTLTNVAKIKDIVINDHARQRVYYDDGVGADDSGLSKLISGATGHKINNKIIEGYQFIMQNWTPHDSIYLFGFSRGAYTVRYIADFIAHNGLLMLVAGETSEQQFQRVEQYFNQYKKARNTEGVKIDLSIANKCIIKMIGVWDTVGELGIPLSVLTKINHNLYEFHDNLLHPNVLSGYQALAIDEQRKNFIPCLWQPRAGVTQEWFAGVHSDVGGGYIESGLSDFTLSWMVDKAYKQQGILINASPFTSIRPDPLDTLHDSSSAFPYKALPKKTRTINEGALINNGVKTRMENKDTHYSPSNLPRSFKFV